jgi:hypothetical protein
MPAYAIQPPSTSDNVNEADPLLCECGSRMRIVSFITDPRVIDRLPPQSSTLCNNSEAPADVRMLIGTSGRSTCVSTMAESPADPPKNRTGRGWTKKDLA